MATKHNDDGRPRSSNGTQGTLGQFSLAPATQTTVVTTTTTTTTSFPPFVMTAPRCLRKRDPELYPMAARPTPKTLKKLVFDIGGQTAVFEEAEESDRSSRNTPLRTSREGTQSRSTKSNRKNKSGMTRPTSSSRQELEEMDGLRRQSATPLSIAEDADSSASDSAELGTFLRRHQGPLMPSVSLSKYESAADGQKGSKRSIYDSDDTHTFDGEENPFTNCTQNVSAFVPPQRRPPMPMSDASEDPFAKRLSRSRSFSRLAQTPAGSATPPVGESDAGYFDESSRNTGTRSSAPDAIITSTPQDASLPSPSLSPITAAAHLNRRPRLASPALEVREANTTTLNSPHLISPEEEPEEIGDVVEKVSSSNQRMSASFTDIPGMLDGFDAMPENLKCYVLYQLLRRSAKPTLHFVADSIAPALKCDFLRRLPLELSQHVIRYLDVQSMTRAAQVSKKWRYVVNSDEKAWKDLLTADGFTIPEGEVQRAVREGWGWQFSTGVDECEMNLNPNANQNFVDLSEGQQSDQLGSYLTPAPSRTGGCSFASPKRKRNQTNKSSSNKKQRRKANREPDTPELPEFSLDSAYGPNAFASAALAAVPNPQVGLHSLRSLHLFKSIYQRHYQIRKSWLDPATKPKHIAFRAHERHVVTCLQFDSEKILTGSDDAIIDIYSTQTGAQLKRLSGHEGGVWALEYQGDILVSGSTDRSVRVWNIQTGRCLQVFQGHTSTVRCLQIVNPVKVGTNLDGSPKMMPKEPLIITGSRDSTCRVWKLPKLDGRSIFQAGPSAVDFDNPYFVRSLAGHAHSVRAIAAHGDTLVSGSYDASVRVWSISTGETIHRLTGHSTKVYSVVLDHERGRCISGSMDNYVKVWSLETGECLFNLTGHNSLVGLLDLKDNYLVSAAADSTLKIWDPESGKIQHTLKAHTGAITCFSHDGQKVISGSDRTLKMWNTRTGQCVRDLLTDLNGVWQVRFDERRCIAAVNRNDWTFIEVLDFGACRDGVEESDRGRRIVVNADGDEVGEDIVADEDLDGDDDEDDHGGALLDGITQAASMRVAGLEDDD